MRIKNLMISFIAVVILILPILAYAGGCGSKAAASCSAECTIKTDNTETKAKAEKATLNTAALKTLMANNVQMIVVDARTGKYDDGRRIGNAQTLSPQATAEEIAKVIPSKDDLVVAYCSNVKCPASTYLWTHLNKMGYHNVVVYPEGIDGWMAAENHHHDEAVINTTALTTLKRSGTNFTVLNAWEFGDCQDGCSGAVKATSTQRSVQDVKTMVTNQNELIVVNHCSSQDCSADTKLTDHLKEMGYTNVIQYEEGITDHSLEKL